MKSPAKRVSAYRSVVTLDDVAGVDEAKQEVMKVVKILKVHCKGKPFDGETDLEVIAKQTVGFSGADLENIVNEAAMLAARSNKQTISMTELEEAIDRVVAGPERKSRIISDWEKSITAFHEAGCSLAAYTLPKAPPVHKISVFGDLRPYSEHTAEEIDQEVKDVIEEARQRAKSILTQHRDKLRRIAAALRERETLLGSDLIELCVPPPRGECGDPRKD